VSDGSGIFEKSEECIIEGVVTRPTDSENSDPQNTQSYFADMLSGGDTRGWRFGRNQD